MEGGKSYRLKLFKVISKNQFQSYFQPASIDRQMLQRNVQRTMDIVFHFMDIAAFLNSLFTWQYPLRSVIGLVVYIIIGILSDKD